MFPIYGQFTIQKNNQFTTNIEFQNFLQKWTAITNFNEIVKRRCDPKTYLEDETSPTEIVIETFFTDEEAQHLRKAFPEQFQVLVYG